MNAITSKRLQVSLPNDTTIVLTRSFNAPRKLVWGALTEPSKMRRWMMPPPGWTMIVCECEARVGGALKIVFESEGAAQVMTLQGVFTEAVPHERMVHTEKMTMGSGEAIGSQVETHELEEESGVTLLRMTQVYPSKEGRDGALASGQDEGMEACYQRVDALLAQPV